MAIKKYGMDAAEIEHLKAANLTDEEINDINKKRVQEQMEDEKETGSSDDDVIASYASKMPNTPNVVSVFVFARIGDSADEDLLKAIDSFFKENKNACNAVNHSVGNKDISVDGFELKSPEVMIDNYMDYAFPTELITDVIKAASSKCESIPDVLTANPFLGS